MTSHAPLAGLIDWVSQESPTSDAASVNAMMDKVVAEAGGQGIAVERIPGREGLGDTVVLRAGPATAAKPALLLSHLDTVHPLGTAARHLPVRVEGDRLYGPGVYDMKGGAWFAFQAFRAAVAAGSLARPAVFAFTPDEEIGSPITRALIEALGRQAQHVLVTEPARDGGRIVTARKGVGRFDVAVEGRPAHAGTRHQDGRSAIREAARQILEVEAMTDYERGVTTTVALVSGGTAANVVPQHARFSIDLRVASAADGEAYEARILGLKPQGPDVRVSVTGSMNRPPYEKTPEVAALFERARALAAQLPDGLAYDLRDCPMTGGGSDGNFTAVLGTPTLDGLGIDGDGAHTLDEYALISSIAPRQALIRALLEQL